MKNDDKFIEYVFENFEKAAICRMATEGLLYRVQNLAFANSDCDEPGETESVWDGAKRYLTQRTENQRRSSQPAHSTSGTATAGGTVKARSTKSKRSARSAAQKAAV